MAFKIYSIIRARFFNQASDTALDIGLNGETQPKLSIDAGGKISWGAGDASAVDTNLYRDEANVLKTDDTFKAASLFVDGIEIDTTGAATGYFLTYDGTKFSPENVTFGSSDVEQLDDLLDVSLGTPTTDEVLVYNGSYWTNASVAAAVENIDDIADVVITSANNGDLLQYDGTNWVNAVQAGNEPIGHENKADSVISFNNGTRTFSIAPASSSFTVWCKGNRYVKSGTETVTIGTTTGLYYIYFSSTGVLSYRTSYFDWENDTPTAYIYWNATTSKAEFFADERHGVTLDWQTHEYLHRTRGAAIASGFGISGYSTDGDGSSDAHHQIALTGGTFFDEDLQVDVTHSASPTANTWEQTLEGTAEIPVFYLSGSAWVKDTATTSPFKAGTSRAQYNYYDGSTWTTADVQNNKYGAMWIVATNNLNEPVIAVLGQTAADNQSTIEEQDWEDLTLTDFPIFEFRPLYKIAFVASDTFSNTLKAAIRGVTDIRRAVSAGSGIPGTPVSDHGSLTGLADDDHTQYLTTGRHDAHDHSTAMSTVVINDISDVSAGSPSSGDFLKWNGSAWVNGAGASAVTISDTPPGSASSGDLWWESDTGKLKIYYNDGDSSQWVDAHTTRANVQVLNTNIDGGSASSNYGGIVALNGGSA